MQTNNDDLCSQLQDVSDVLGDRILSLLRDAIAEGQKSRPPQEKLLSRARTAIDKAIGLIEQADRMSDQ